MFSQVRSELEQYAAWLRDRGPTETADHLLQEVRLRLRHLEWIYNRCMELDQRFQAAALRSLPDKSSQPSFVKQIFHEQSIRDSDPTTQASLPFQPHDELWVLLEAFYYSAHRVRDILRDNKRDLPGESNFDSAGVRVARNHLVEHTGKSGGVAVPSIGCGGPVGPQLRSIRWSLDPKGSTDPGLQANAL
jgi:hypothetical protein